MKIPNYSQTYQLPHNFRVTFAYADQHLSADWDPDFPARYIRKPRARRRFERAYFKARGDFLRDVATIAGLTIAVVDGGAEPSATVIRPRTKQ